MNAFVIFISFYLLYLFFIILFYKLLLANCKVADRLSFNRISEFTFVGYQLHSDIHFGKQSNKRKKSQVSQRDLLTSP